MIALLTWFLGLFTRAPARPDPLRVPVVDLPVCEAPTHGVQHPVVVHGVGFWVSDWRQARELQQRANTCLVLHAVGVRLRGCGPRRAPCRPS